MAAKKPSRKKTTSKTRTAKRAKTTRAEPRTPAASRFTVHVVSDATGSLARHLVRTVMTQFPGIEFKRVYHTFRDTPEHIEDTIAKFGSRREIVLHAIVDPDAKRAIRVACIQKRIPHFDLTDPLVQFFADTTGTLPSGELARVHTVDEDYFNRIQAMEFTAQHDDSRGLDSLHEADIVLVGLSRVSKSPTSTFLGSLGFKTANVSITSDTGFPKELRRVKSRIVALTVQPRLLGEIRSQRLDSFGVDENDYSNLQEVIREVVWAEQQYARRGYPIIDMTDTTIERIAALVLKQLKIKQTNVKIL